MFGGECLRLLVGYSVWTPQEALPIDRHPTKPMLKKPYALLSSGKSVSTEVRGSMQMRGSLDWSLTVSIGELVKS